MRVESTEKIWLSQYPDEIPARLHYEQKNLAQLFEEAVQKDPKKSAIYFLGKKMTFSQLHQDSLKLSSYLIKLGLKRGDRVAIMLPNCPQAVISFYAVLLAGGVVVQTNPLYTERELEYQLNDSEATMIIALDLLYPRVVKMKALTKIKHVVITSIQDYLPFPKNIIYPFIQRKQQKISVDVSHTETTHLFKRIINESSPAVCNAEGISDEDIAILQYTGGTTG
ncbi:AMP-binding protein, partial [Priestia megaterium]